MAERAMEGEGFLGRWARLKREARAEEPAVPAVQEPVAEAPAVTPAETGDEPDLSDLPPLDSLDAGSDYTGFLRPDVPAELRRQALRKAWASDPAIAGFRGFAEYDWDYNAPGYGALLPTDDIARLLDAVLPDEKREEEDGKEEEVAVVEGMQEDSAAGLHSAPPPPAGGGGLTAEPVERRNALPRPAEEGLNAHDSPQMHRPPSTSRQTPVRKLPSSEHR